MFGLTMAIAGEGQRPDLLMRAIEKEEVTNFLPGMQSLQVGRFLGKHGVISAQTEQDELEWWEKSRESATDISWGIYVPEGEGWRMIGTSSLHGVKNPSKIGSSGFVIAVRDWWGKGIAGACHIARTHYAYQVLDLLAVHSKVAQGNAGSLKALQRVGYVVHGLDLSERVIEGRVHNADMLTQVNPERCAWQYFWRGTRPSKAFAEARKLTVTALERAQSIVTFP